MGNQDNRGTLVDKAYNHINDDLRKRFYNPGQKLILRELSERYGISQTPIKQALNRLISERVIENIPRYGMYVRRISRKEIMDMLQARLMIEKFCIPFIIEKASDPDFIRRLDEIMQKHSALQNRAETEDIIPAHIKYDRQFHLLLVSSCDNSSIYKYYSDLISPVFFNYVYFAKTIQRLMDSYLEHQKIFSAVKDKNFDLLQTTIELHNKNTCLDYERLLNSQQ
ncbi:MAG: GntR family transcriptional regulator [Oscillospiraceae bacterium]